MDDFWTLWGWLTILHAAFIVGATTVTALYYRRAHRRPVMMVCLSYAALTLSTGHTIQQPETAVWKVSLVFWAYLIGDVGLWMLLARVVKDQRREEKE